LLPPEKWGGSDPAEPVSARSPGTRKQPSRVESLARRLGPWVAGHESQAPNLRSRASIPKPTCYLCPRSELSPMSRLAQLVTWDSRLEI
jgi:hypothetical protein